MTEGSLSAVIAKAVVALDASYVAKPIGTVIGADGVDEPFEAVPAAHLGVDRARAFLEIVDQRTTDDPANHPRLPDFDRRFDRDGSANRVTDR